MTLAVTDIADAKKTLREDKIIARALKIIQTRAEANIGIKYSSPMLVKQYFRLFEAKQQDQFRERFKVMFLDTQNRCIAMEVMFEGSLAHAAVYPREIVKRALHHNAASVILSHNHPSGNLEFSQADISVTKRIKEALDMVDIRTMDHILTASSTETKSMAELGMI